MEMVDVQWTTQRHILHFYKMALIGDKLFIVDTIRNMFGGDKLKYVSRFTKRIQLK